jgi:hypothetical protein
MRKNELKSLEELKTQYVGIWAPSDGHWFGLDFSYHDVEYRLHTGSMYGGSQNCDDNGIVRQFGLYRKTDKIDPKHKDVVLYELLDEKESLEKLLDSKVIEGTPFSIVIMDDDTILLGQD